MRELALGQGITKLFELREIYRESGFTAITSLGSKRKASMGKDTVRLGFAVQSGREIEIPIRHLAVIGQTQESGKTTTLEALVERSGRKAVAFVTKRAEASFMRARRIPAYFRERADWQFVSALLESTFREKMRFERSWIMRVSKGAHSLVEVNRNVEKALETARGLNENVYLTLHEYLSIVLPQIEKLDYTKRLELMAGINVIDLAAYTAELQALIIRSVLEWIYEREQETIVIIPEAWEFIPQQRGSPVKLACEQLIRKGAASKNYVWLDSQDIAGVAKDVLRQVSVWILGVQREAHEIKRTLAHIPVSSPKPTPDQIMTLGKGEFFVNFGREMHRVYVQPAWLSDADAHGIAIGNLPVSVAEASKQRAIASAEQQELPRHDTNTDTNPDLYCLTRSGESREEEEMYQEKYEAEKVRADRLEKDVEKLNRELSALRKQSNPAKPVATSSNGAVDLDAVYSYVRDRMRSEPTLLKLAMELPHIEVEYQRPTIEVDHKTLRGRLAKLIVDGFFDEVHTGSAAHSELARRGFSTAKPNVYKELDRLAELGFVTKEANGYATVEGMKVSVKS